MRYASFLFCLFAINFQSFSQNKRGTINYDSEINKTFFVNFFKADTVTLNDNWRETKTINSSYVNPHFTGLRNTNKDCIEIALRLKKEDQFYVKNISDAALLNKDAAFESYRYKANKNAFEKIYNNDTCYVFNEKKNGMKVITLVGIKNDHIIKITSYPAVKDKTKNLDYLLTLFTNLNIK